MAAMLLLRRHLPHLFRAASPLPSPIHHRSCPLLSTSAPASPFSLEDYLVASCGLAPAQARETAQKAFDEIFKAKKKAFDELSKCRLNSASNPDAVLALLSSVGLSRADIAAVVVADPLLLRSSPKNIAPRLLALRDRIVQRPVLFTYSLEKRLVLQHCVVKVLLAKGLLNSNRSFNSLVQVREEIFKSRYIDRHRDSVPELADAYATACGGIVPSGV